MSEANWVTMNIDIPSRQNSTSNTIASFVYNDLTIDEFF
jgi:hypothetical protein